jgi:hypothetical protein
LVCGNSCVGSFASLKFEQPTLLKESNAMILKRLCLVAFVFMVASLGTTAQVVSAESFRAFRQKNGLQAYVPPDWFLGGYFVAREKNPGYVFGPVQDFVGAKRAFHGRKAKEYYGKTRRELERALSQGLNINAELRFWIENGETSLQAPEDVIMSRYKFQPVFDLGKGRRPDPAAKTE